MLISLDTPLAALPLPTGLITRLIRAGLGTLADLHAADPAELRVITGVGPTGAIRIQRLLAAHAPLAIATVPAFA